MSSGRHTFRQHLHNIIFGTDTRAGRLFDLCLLCAIVMSVLVVIIDSTQPSDGPYQQVLFILEWLFTGLFTLEYLLRIYVTPKPSRYIFSFWGIVDLFSFLPAFLGLMLANVHFLVAIRVLRLMRIFRILKLGRYFRESQELGRALWASAHKISVFFVALMLIVLIMGSLIYVIEGGQNGFENIPQSIYWAIITVTTVGYGDVVPVTPLGKFVSSLIMILGYSIIAVPTGIITAEMTRTKKTAGTIYCSQCGHPETEPGSNFCRKCGARLVTPHPEA